MTSDKGTARGTDEDDGRTFELEGVEDFRAISENGWVSVVGFGSLLSEKSARFTFPTLKDFRVGRIRGYRRVFAHVAPIFLERGIARIDTREMSSLSVEEAEGECILVTLFEMAMEEVYPEPLDALDVLDATSPPIMRRAVICGRYSDEEYRNIRLKGDPIEYHVRYGKWGITKIWDDHLLPCRLYLRHCVLAAQNLSQEMYDNFLDHTFLADRKTTIRRHLELNPSLMTEVPPEELAERYGG